MASGVSKEVKTLRAVPAFVTAHTFCTSRDTMYSGFLCVVSTNTGIFLCCLKLCEENRT